MAAPEQPASQRQLRYLQAVAREAGLDTAAIDMLAFEMFECSALQLNRRDTSSLIDRIQTDSKEQPTS